MGVALITPFKEDDSVDYDALLRLVDYQLQNGTDFLCVLGTTAETPTLTKEEKDKIKRLIIERVNGRIPILLPVTWKDHFPFFGQNGHVPEEIEVHSTRPGYIYQPLVGSDDFCNGLLPRWQFNHDPDPRYYHLDALQGTYTITTREVCTELTQAVNTLTQRMSYPSCAAEVTVDASALKEGDVAGLCALQSCYAAVGITKRHGKYEVLMLDKKEDGILDMTEGTVVESHQMDFRLEADFCNMKDEARCYYRVNKGDWLPIGTVHKLYFKLDHFTGCRFGLFCYAAEETGGSACFRDFKYYDVDEIS